MPRLRGKAKLVRFADDFVIVFEHKHDAGQVKDLLPERFGQYGLTIGEVWHGALARLSSTDWFEFSFYHKSTKVWLGSKDIPVHSCSTAPPRCAQ